MQRAVPFGEVPGFPTATVVGHAGRLIVGRLGGRSVVALAGRFHMYEGHDAAHAGFPVRVLHALGARTLFVSNAAGGINPDFAPGDLMIITDHINLMFRNPLVGALEAGDMRFPDMSEPYDRALPRCSASRRRRSGFALREGVYCGLLGPTYETPAEVRMLRVARRRRRRHVHRARGDRRARDRHARRRRQLHHEPRVRRLAHAALARRGDRDDGPRRLAFETLVERFAGAALSDLERARRLRRRRTLTSRRRRRVTKSRRTV